MDKQYDGRDEVGNRIHWYWLRAKWNDLADQLVAFERHRAAAEIDCLFCGSR